MTLKDFLNHFFVDTMGGTYKFKTPSTAEQKKSKNVITLIT